MIGSKGSIMLKKLGMPIGVGELIRPSKPMTLVRPSKTKWSFKLEVHKIE